MKEFIILFISGLVGGLIPSLGGLYFFIKKFNKLDTKINLLKKKNN